MGIFLKCKLLIFISLLLFLSFVRFSAGGEAVRVIINEFLPDPVGSDTAGEWIELKNIGSGDVVLAGWKICDLARRCYQFKENEKIIAGGFLVLDKSLTKISINNSDETLSLYAPQDQKAFSISFTGQAPEGRSFSRFGKNDWRWTPVATKNEENFWQENEEKSGSVSLSKDSVIEKKPETSRSSAENEKNIFQEISRSKKIIFPVFAFGFALSGLISWIIKKWLKN